MSSLWTPGGERPVERPTSASDAPRQDPPPGGAGPGAGRGVAGGAAPGDDELSDEELAAQLDELRAQLAETPVEVVIANHAFGLFELAALHLSLQPPNLTAARTAIDALGSLVEGMVGRLGEPETQLVDGLAQLRMAFVQISGARPPE